MNNNWTYKKLGEVVTIERGGSPRPIQNYLTNDENGLNWIKIGDAVPDSKYITSTKEKIKPEGLSKTRFVHKGDFILSNSMSFGRPYILAIDGCIHDGWLVLHDYSNIFNKSYLYYYLSSPEIYEEFKRLAVGGVVNNLNSDIVRKVKVAIPPLSEQEAIVKELDLIHSIIDKKNEQLRELDNLAQSIFYTMFGDPIVNEKNWEVKKLGEVGTIIGGGTPKTDEKANWIGTNSWVTPAELKDKYIYKTERTISDEAARHLELMPIGTVLLSSRAPIGKLAITRIPMCCNQGFKNIVCGELLDSEFTYYYLFFNIPRLQDMGVGATFKEISKSSVQKFPIILPPLSLQQEFAKKVEAIEAQKELIRKSIAEVETLLASRMQYHFG